MSLTNQLIRPDVLSLSAYHVQNSAGFVKLDAMENPYTLPPELQQELAQELAQLPFNRYPIPSYAALKAAIGAQLGVPEGFDIVLGNGSDELISIASVACAKPGAKVLAPIPGFVMYAMSARLAGMEFVGVPLQADFSLNMPAMLSAIETHQPAIIYLAYPNNPTGNLFAVAEVEAILRAAQDSIVIVDEAYQPFAEGTFMPRLAEFGNLVVMRTVSKLGLAGIRLGYMSGSAALMHEFDKVRPPYNINVLTEATANFLLKHTEVLDQQAANLRQQREELSHALRQLPGVEVFPSSANFLLIRLPQADLVFAKLMEQKILVKNVGKMDPLLENCLRITVSTSEENALFLTAFSASLASS